MCHISKSASFLVTSKYFFAVFKINILDVNSTEYLNLQAERKVGILYLCLKKDTHTHTQIEI